MSYDLSVFDAAVAPRDRAAFLEWFIRKTQWSELSDYNNPDNPASELRNWFTEIIRTFPPMNGPLATDDVDNPKMTDYSLDRSLIYAAFAWSQADEAYQATLKLAAKHRVGFFDVSSDTADIWFPTADGGIQPLPSSGK